MSCATMRRCWRRPSVCVPSSWSGSAGLIGRRSRDREPEACDWRSRVLAREFRLLNEAKTPPFQIAEDSPVSEDLRLRYRYLDLRRPRLQANIALRHRVALAVREYLDAQGFWEIETPILTKSTPEGARDYLVPSRVHPGEFFALPQSPQIFKQILMIAGADATSRSRAVFATRTCAPIGSRNHADRRLDVVCPGRQI